MDKRKHPISELQEALAKRKLAPPVYDITAKGLCFQCTVTFTVHGQEFSALGTALSKSTAKYQAAEEALKIWSEIHPRNFKLTSLTDDSNTSSSNQSFQKHPISELQELLMKSGKAAPTYTCTPVTSNGITPSFRCTVTFDGNVFESVGMNKSVARTETAQKVLGYIKLKSDKSSTDIGTINTPDESKDDCEDFERSPERKNRNPESILLIDELNSSSLNQSLERHPISELQELLAKSGRAAPTYICTSDTSNSITPSFRCTLTFDGKLFESVGMNKSIAKTETARKVLTYIKLKSDKSSTDIDTMDTSNESKDDCKDVEMSPESSNRNPESILLTDDSNSSSLNQSLERHPISELQELLAKSGRAAPTYICTSDTSNSITPSFRCTLTFDGKLFESVGMNKSIAKTETARKVLNYIKLNPEDLSLPKAFRRLSTDINTTEARNEPKDDNLVVSEDKNSDSISLNKDSISSSPCGARNDPKDDNLVVSEDKNSDSVSLNKDSTSSSLCGARNDPKDDNLVVSEDKNSDSASLNEDSISSFPFRSHPVSELLEKFAKHGRQRPTFTCAVVPNPLVPRFRYALTFADETFEAEGASKAAAKTEAARKALQYIRSDPSCLRKRAVASPPAEAPRARNAVGALNEFLQKRRAQPAGYKQMGVNEVGEFRFCCSCLGESAFGTGTDKKAAKQRAAENMMRVLETSNKVLRPTPPKNPTTEPELITISDEDAVNKYVSEKNTLQYITNSDVFVHKPKDLCVDEDLPEDKEKLLSLIKNLGIPYEICKLPSKDDVVLLCLTFQNEEHTTFLSAEYTYELAYIRLLQRTLQGKDVLFNNC